MAPRTSAKICGMGHSMKRKEDPRFLQGKGNFIDDHTLPGCCGSTSFAARSPTARS